MLSGDSVSVDETNTAAAAIRDVTGGYSATACDSAGTEFESAGAEFESAGAESDSAGAGSDSAGAGFGAVGPVGPVGSEGRAGLDEGEAVVTGAESAPGEPDPMTAWAQSWSSSTEDRAGVLPVSEWDLSGVQPITQADLAHVVETIEKYTAILGRIQTLGLDNSDRRALLMRTEAVSRSLFGYSHTWIADLVHEHGLDGIYGSVPEALAVLLRLSLKRSGQRILMAEQFGERASMTGERLEPHLAVAAHGATDGVLDEEHQQIIRKFFKKLGSKVDAETAREAEAQLVQLARDLLPDAFAVAARRLYDILDPDGDLDEEQVADRCYLHLDAQGEDGLSKGRFLIDSEFRAYLEAAFDKWAKPGVMNPADDHPATGDPGAQGSEEQGTTGPAAGRGDPSLFDDDGDGKHGHDDHSDSDSDIDDIDEGVDEGDGNSHGHHGGDRSHCDSDSDGGDDGDGDQDNGDHDGGGGGGGGGSNDDDDGGAEAEARARRDRRGRGRRQHDAMKTILRQMLASGQLGRHRGLPVTAVVTMSLKDLESASGYAVTGTGSMVRMRDAIRMASHAHHYLVIFDDRGRPLHLGRSKRIASADQRIVLIAADRGCSFPGCTRPATWSQVHHIDEWGQGGNTDIETLTFGCDMHHPLVGPSESQWATTKAGPDHPYPGRTLWHPPVAVDPLRRGRINHYHHPNEYIYPSDVLLPGTDCSPESPDTRASDRETPGGRGRGGPEPAAPPA